MTDGNDRTEPDRDRTRGEAVSLPWFETAERELRDVVCTGTIVVLAAVVIVSVYRALTGVPGNHWGAAAFGLILALLGWFIWYGPMGGVGARASVDARGLWVRHIGWTLRPWDVHIELSPVKHLPAAEIGEIILMTGERRRELWRKAVSLDFDGRRVGWTRANLDRDTGVAVLIEQNGPDLRRPWWSLKCHDCEALVAALRLARDLAADGRPRPHDPADGENRS